MKEIQENGKVLPFPSKIPQKPNSDYVIILVRRDQKEEIFESLATNGRQELKVVKMIKAFLLLQGFYFVSVEFIKLFPDQPKLLLMLGIGIIITVITAAGRDSLIEVGFLLILACLVQNMFGYTLGYYIAKLLRLKEKDCRTIALEVGMQNGGLASGLAMQMGKIATVGLAPAVFGPMMNITGSSLATWWRSKSPE